MAKFKGELVRDEFTGRESYVQKHAEGIVLGFYIVPVDPMRQSPA